MFRGLKEKKIMKKVKKFFTEERGIETIEVVIILVIIVALGFAFRNVITDWYNHLVSGVESQVLSDPTTIPYGL